MVITFIDALALLFIGLKLAGVGEVSHWSWWLVLAPVWIPFVWGFVRSVVRS